MKYRVDSLSVFDMGAGMSGAFLLSVGMMLLFGILFFDFEEWTANVLFFPSSRNTPDTM